MDSRRWGGGSQRDAAHRQQGGGHAVVRGYEDAEGSRKDDDGTGAARGDGDAGREEGVRRQL